jgi:D-alanine-D-alanine ligase
MSLTKKRVALLRGGKGEHYESSIKTGSFVLKHIPEHFEVFDCLIDKDGVWHLRGIPRKPEKILSQVDIVFNALHGSYGGNGQIQNLFKTHNVKHTGSDVFPSVLSTNKHFSKNIWKQIGLKIPNFSIVDKEDINKNKIYEIFTNLPNPLVIKPVSSGISLGVSFAYSLKDLEDAIEKAFAFSSKVIIEEFIKGREVIVGLISGFRNEKLYSLPALEIKKEDNIYHHNHKYEGGVKFDHLSLNPLEKAEVDKIAKLAYKTLGLSSYGSVDMIVHPKRGVFLLEVNTEPPLHEHSPFVQAFDLVGIKPEHFFDHILQNTLN